MTIPVKDCVSAVQSWWCRAFFLVEIAVVLTSFVTPVYFFFVFFGTAG